MAIEPNDLLLFARIADAGSLTKAAQALGLPKSTVSRRLAALEETLGERLLLRTTRKRGLTDFGRSVLDHARHVADEVAATAMLAEMRSAEPNGRLRVSMPGDLASLVLAEMLAAFLARHPRIELELDLTPRRVDLHGESFDVALRMGDLGNDASLAARRLATWTSSLYAAPAYLARKGRPTRPDDLLAHETVRLLTRTGDADPWTLHRGDERWRGAPPTRATANSPDLLIRLARAGTGIALVKDHFALPYLRGGELVPVLAEWTGPRTDAWAVFPGHRLLPSRTRVFIDMLVETFSGPECVEVDRDVQAARAEIVAIR